MSAKVGTNRSTNARQLDQKPRTRDRAHEQRSDDQRQSKFCSVNCATDPTGLNQWAVFQRPPPLRLLPPKRHSAAACPTRLGQSEAGQNNDNQAPVHERYSHL
jgi:hypothetical protein